MGKNIKFLPILALGTGIIIFLPISVTPAFIISQHSLLGEVWGSHPSQVQGTPEQPSPVGSWAPELGRKFLIFHVLLDFGSCFVRQSRNWPRRAWLPPWRAVNPSAGQEKGQIIPLELHPAGTAQERGGSARPGLVRGPKNRPGLV